MNHDQEKRCQKEKLDILYYELYNLHTENAFSISIILAKESEKAALEKPMADAKAAYDALNVPQGSKKTKKSEPEKKELGLARNKYEGLNFTYTAIKGRISKLHEEVARKANSIRAISKNIKFIEEFEMSKVPQLPYLEINGTRYATKDNAHVLDDQGQMVLYVESHDQTNTTQKPTA